MKEWRAREAAFPMCLPATLRILNPANLFCNMQCTTVCITAAGSQVAKRTPGSTPGMCPGDEGYKKKAIANITYIKERFNWDVIALEYNKIISETITNFKK